MPEGEWKMPLIAKVYEAFSTVVDGRVEIGVNTAYVMSSDYSKKYKITWEDDVYSSNDNASYWQGSLGYPVIAVLMKQGKLSFDSKIAAHFSGIQWKKLIRSLKNDYTLAAAQVLQSLQEKGVNIKPIMDEANNVYEQIKSLNIKRKRGSARPPV